MTYTPPTDAELQEMEERCAKVRDWVVERKEQQKRLLQYVRELKAELTSTQGAVENAIGAWRQWQARAERSEAAVESARSEDLAARLPAPPTESEGGK